MRNKLFVLCAAVGCGTNLLAAMLCSGNSAAVKIDQATGARVSAASEAIRYSAAWETTASGATAVVAVNGATLKSATGTGSVAWTPTRNGTYTLTHKVMNGSSQVGNTLSAMFTVAGIYPENPTISPATETKFVGSQEVTLSCGTADATIYYTLDGSVPTLESLVYDGPFSVMETTTVIARAFFENGDASPETVTATYILNKVEAPVISPTTGTTFDSSLTVNMSCPTEGATIRYTTDGSEPTEESPIYTRFKITARTKIKARAFVDGMVASDVVTAEYALGTCSDPVFSLGDGTVFQHSNQEVLIAWDDTDGTLRYTTDGSEPTTDSPVYAGAFTISETTTVKAKVFGESFFDSTVVTSVLTREWLKVATPVVTALDSFTGSKTEVSLACATEGAVIRYTLDGREPNSHSPKYTVPFMVDQTVTVKAYAVLADYTNSDVASKTITKIWGVGDSVGVSDQAFATSGNAGWIRDASVSYDGNESVRSGEIVSEQRSILETKVMGKGTVSFRWKASTENTEGDFDWDHGEFHADGEAYFIEGATDWQPISHTFTTDGEHTLQWIYVKDDFDDTPYGADDCIWMDAFVWEPVPAVEETQTTEVPVPFAWLKAKYSELTDAASYEAKANEMASNGVNKVWECYVIGLEPTAVDARFVASIEMVEGVPKVTWSPDLGAERVYKVFGSTDLKTWTEVTDKTKSSCNFFRVRVEMK